MGKLSSDFPNAQAVDAALKRANKAEVDVANLTTAMAGKVGYSAYQTETQNLQGQINQIAQTAGTGTADTEIGQARVGADGTEYETLKERLDSETGENSEALTDLKSYSYKIASFATVDELSKETRTYIDYHLYKDHHYTITNNTSADIGVAGYNQQKVLVETFRTLGAGESEIITPTANSYYLFLYALADVSSPENLFICDMGSMIFATDQALIQQESENKDTQNKLNEVAEVGLNQLNYVSYTEDYCYYSDPYSKKYLPNNALGLFDKIRISAGKTYYFKNIYAYFSWILYDSGTYSRFTNDTHGSNGSFTATENGYVFITIYKAQKNAGLYIFTDSQYMYDNGIYDTYVDINNYSDAFPNIKNVIRGNIFDPETAIDGKFINPNNGNVSNNAAYTASDYIAVAPETNVEIQFYNTAYGAFYRDDKTFIAGSGIIYEHYPSFHKATITVPEEAHYIRISTATNVLDALSVIAKEFIKGFFVHTDQVDGLDHVKYTTYSVGASGYDYTTLRAAFAACTNGSKNNRYIVEFHGDGTEYDIADEFTEDDLSDSDFIGITVPKYTKLRGFGGKKKNIIVLRLDSASSKISTLNLYGSSEIEGLTVIGSNTRYTIHDDYPDADARRTISDCEIVAESSVYHGTWGAGSRSGNNWKFMNCKFVSNESDTVPFFCHNNVRFTEPTIISFENCRFVNSADTSEVVFRSLNNNANGIINEVYMYGCAADSVKLIEERAELYGSGILFDCSGYGNTFSNSDCTYTSTDGIDYSDRFDFI